MTGGGVVVEVKVAGYYLSYLVMEKFVGFKIVCFLNVNLIHKSDHIKKIALK